MRISELNDFFQAERDKVELSNLRIAAIEGVPSQIKLRRLEIENRIRRRERDRLQRIIRIRELEHERLGLEHDIKNLRAKAKEYDSRKRTTTPMLADQPADRNALDTFTHRETQILYGNRSMTENYMLDD